MLGTPPDLIRGPGMAGRDHVRRGRFPSMRLLLAACATTRASWPHSLRPSTSRRRTGPIWMRGSSPRMTRWGVRVWGAIAPRIGTRRSVCHRQGPGRRPGARRFNHFPQAPGARSARLATRHSSICNISRLRYFASHVYSLIAASHDCDRLPDNQRYPFRQAVEPSGLPSILRAEATDFRDSPNDQFLRAIAPARFAGTLTVAVSVPAGRGAERPAVHSCAPRRPISGTLRTISSFEPSRPHGLLDFQLPTS